MKSTRTSFKRHVHIPYGEAPRNQPVVAPGSYALAARQHRAYSRRQDQVSSIRRLMSRVVNALTGHSGPAPLRPGDVIRDFPYFTQVSEVQYFSTHPSLVVDTFGFWHGTRLKFGRGAWSGQEATVVGVLGGRLWVVLQGDAIARVLPMPSVAGASLVMDVPEEITRLCPTSTWVRQRLISYYGITVLYEEDGTTKSTESSPTMSTNGNPFTPALMAEVAEEAQRLYTPQQREFLQRAPDLYVHLVDEDGAPAAPEDGQNASPTSSRAGSPHSPLGSSGTQQQQAPSLYQHFIDDREGAGSRLVLLAPRVILSSGTVGWAGEGTVVANAGGVYQSHASLSASIVV